RYKRIANYGTLFRREAATEYSPGHQSWEAVELIEEPQRGGRICHPFRARVAADCEARAGALGYLPTRLNAQFNPEPASLARFGIHTDAAAHQFDGFTDGGQSQSYSWKLLFGIKPDKRHKNPLLIFLGNTDSIVVDFDAAKVFLHGCRDGDLGLNTFGHKFDCIR